MFKLPHHIVKKKLINRLPSLHPEHEYYRWWILGNIMIGTFIAVLDATIVNVGLPSIMASFGTSIDKIEWVITAYLLVMGLMLPTSGWVCDHFGYKKTYFFAILLFTTGSSLCGLSRNETELILSRILQGIGAGFLMPTGMAIIMREFPIKQRGLALGFWAISAAASVSFGPLIGGYLIDNLSWHAIFNVNIPFGILGMVATLIIQREYRTENLRSFDIFGFISMGVFLCSLLLALAEGNAAWNTGGWTSTFIISCFIISFLSLVIFLVIELNIEHPFIELRLLKDFNFGVTNIVLFLFGIGMFGSTFLLPLYLQNMLGYTAIQAGMVFFPVGLLQGVVAPISGLMSDKLNPKIPALIGIILLAFSLYLNNFLSLFSQHAQIMFPLYIRGFSMGLLFTPLSNVALSNISRNKMAQASGLFNVIRQLGGSFGIAIFGTILSRRNIFHISTYGESVNQYSPTFQEINKKLQFFIQMNGGNSQAETLIKAKALIGAHISQQAFVRSVDDAFFIASIITIIGVIPILLLKINKDNVDEKIAEV